MNAQIEHNFKYHPPVGTAANDHAFVRDAIKNAANIVDTLLPAAAGRERASAIHHLEEAMFWACAGIARHPSTINSQPTTNS